MQYNNNEEELLRKLNDVSIMLERTNINEYVQLLQRPGKMLLINFSSGLVRGLGMAIGFTILGAIVLIILQRIVMLNIPLIGNFVADVIKVVEMQL
ncbi:DUF5665 domain-containing protein [Calorimonas adulescens]|uniref:Uncharacterized protein n=1 Tax=Calorimonas adulescens TaxID=2606906 RepID=A0A5D8QBY1_9THEO|nr:DUF5665 domain-containing protein [Calorimonas adulescens]TZE82022.1 hypothetical protein FWJ32_07265 [Calorimonas adulescens]